MNHSIARAAVLVLFSCLAASSLLAQDSDSGGQDLAKAALEVLPG